MGLKERSFIFIRFSEELELKSDQDGIERLTTLERFYGLISVEIRPRWDWKLRDCPYCVRVLECWNQTKMGLKVFSKKENMLSLWRVEIRPRWDWKLPWNISQKTVKNVEIRPRWDWKEYNPESAQISGWRVEIRPRWDWKQASPTCSLAIQDAKLKSDQDGIERGGGWDGGNRIRGLKSDQDGIERRKAELL